MTLASHVMMWSEFRQHNTSLTTMSQRRQSKELTVYFRGRLAACVGTGSLLDYLRHDAADDETGVFPQFLTLVEVLVLGRLLHCTVSECCLHPPWRCPRAVL